MRKYQEKKRKPTFVDSKQLTESTFEVQETITRIKEEYPIHIGNTILHLSKLLMARFIAFLEKYLIPDSYRLLYSGMIVLKITTIYIYNLDTDSVAICMIGNMDECVKTEFKNEWAEAQKEWFVQDENDPWETRLPGLMKTEWTTRNGAMCA